MRHPSSTRPRWPRSWRPSQAHIYIYIYIYSQRFTTPRAQDKWLLLSDLSMVWNMLFYCFLSSDPPFRIHIKSYIYIYILYIYIYTYYIILDYTIVCMCMYICIYTYIYIIYIYIYMYPPLGDGERSERASIASWNERRAAGEFISEAKIVS